jgi:hypothetical protein
MFNPPTRSRLFAAIEKGVCGLDMGATAWPLPTGMFFTYTQEEGLADELATTVLQDRGGQYLDRHSSGTPALSETEGYYIHAEIPVPRISAMGEDRDGNLVVAMNDRLFRVKLRQRMCAREMRSEFIPVLRTELSE